jgi:hypothetical protein
MTVGTVCTSSLVHPPVVETVWERVVGACVHCRLTLTHACRGVCQVCVPRVWIQAQGATPRPLPRLPRTNQTGASRVPVEMR